MNDLLRIEMVNGDGIKAYCLQYIEIETMAIETWA